jgi:hypothetical protein
VEPAQEPKPKPIAPVVKLAKQIATPKPEEDEPPAAEEGASGGRPSSFKEEYAEQAEALARLGATDKEMAAFFDVSESTLSNWKLAQPEFLEALKRGKIVADMRVTNSLHKRAQFHEYEEEQAIKVKDVVYGENGKKISETERVEVVTVKKVLPPSDMAMIYWLNNRRKEQWRQRIDHEHSGNVNVTHEERVKRREAALAQKRGPQPQPTEADDGTGETRH